MPWRGENLLIYYLLVQKPECLLNVTCSLDVSSCGRVFVFGAGLSIFGFYPSQCLLNRCKHHCTLCVSGLRCGHITLRQNQNHIFILLFQRRMSGEGNPFAHLRTSLEVGGQTFTYYNLKALGKDTSLAWAYFFQI